jgi:hypothetical protein
MVVVVRIARSFFLICTAVTAAICTWSSVHGRHCTHTHTRKKKKERKRKEKNERKKTVDSGAAAMV